MFICVICGNECSDEQRSCKRSQKSCKSCYNQQARERYHKYYGASQRKRVKDLKDKNKGESQAFVRDYLLNHPCADCGETDLIVLEFDHISSDKKYNISYLISSGFPLKTIKKEIEKCEVVCANCHRRRTQRRSGSVSWKILDSAG